MAINYKVLLKNISTFIFDIDGVLTNGSIAIFQNDLIRTLNSKDAYALQYASKLGFKIFIITGGESLTVKKVLLDLGITEVCLKSSNKLEAFERLKHMHRLNVDECLYMGDDIPDIPLLKTVLLPCCPKDASSDVKKVVKYVSPFKGGSGCVRDVLEQTMKAQNKWLTENAHYW